MGSLADHMNAAISGTGSLADREIIYWAGGGGGSGGGAVPLAAGSTASILTGGTTNIRVAPPGALLFAGERLRLPNSKALTSINNDGVVVNLMVCGDTFASPDPYPQGHASIGDPALDFVQVVTVFDLAGNNLIDMPTVGNTDGLYNTRLVQGLDSTVAGFNNLTVGIATMTPTGVNSGVGAAGGGAWIDRVVVNSGQTVENSRVTVKNSRLLIEVDQAAQSRAMEVRKASDSSVQVFVRNDGLIGCFGFTDKTDGGPYVECGTVGLAMNNRGAGSNNVLLINGSGAGQTGLLTAWSKDGGSYRFGVDASATPQWMTVDSRQTTVGAAGGASALPATPTKYLKVKDEAGTTLVIPAYAAS